MLLLPSPDGWSLPRWRHPGPQAVHAEIADRFGLFVTTRDCLEGRGTSETASGAPRYYVHEVHRATTGPAPLALREGRWVTAAGLGGADLAEPGQREALEAVLDRAGDSDGGDRAQAATRACPPWTRAGWYAEAAAWADDRLRGCGRPAAGVPEQPFLRAWSFQLRIPVQGGGAVYFKASPPVFGHEAEVTRLLSDRFPANIPRVLAVDAERHWMLTDDFGGVQRTDSVGEAVEGCATMVPVLARIQREVIGDLPALRAAGCPDHRTLRLPELFAELLANTSSLGIKENRRLAEILPRFRGLCAELADLGVPDSLVHQDIWRGNHTFRNGTPLLFDWAESVIGHPFISLDVALRDLRSAAPGDDAAVRRVTDAYLRGWSRHARAGQLRRAARLAATAGIVSRALLWRSALHGLEPERARPYAGTVEAQLRELLRAPV
ncbi:aminoglycoside phosphotransferase family protein [Streptomyces bambusae]|uniref:Aminoglycoside phosphotransferase family protein n=1 Tax=Streptomyces bambusae TaxID=1550616 RepID=A0ABS6Z1L9_9ACTN|nr:aminoglycoside phosphotransferase family protein [Streptomyces bambusae]MBW5481284.1 hypothetical protein [Streptomyces bambusae]